MRLYALCFLLISLFVSAAVSYAVVDGNSAVEDADEAGDIDAPDVPDLYALAKRRPMDPSDPRNLFAAVYGYRKRVLPVRRRAFYPTQVKRRGLRDPLDPRNLFRAIYGYRK